MGFIDRFLVGAEAYRIPAILVFNKIDFLQTESQQLKLSEWINKYESVGYVCVLQVSAEQELGLDALKNKMKDKLNILSGNSGVGKSTLINKLDKIWI